MNPFFILSFQGSEGSSAIQELLGRHPEVHFIGYEPFDCYRFQQRSADAAELPKLLDLFFSRNETEFSRHTRKIGLPVESVDFGRTQAFKLRLVTHIAKHPASKPKLLAMFHRFKVHQFFVHRKCRLLQELSAYRGHLQFDLKRGTKSLRELRTKIQIDIPKMRKQVEYRSWYFKEHVSIYRRTQDQNSLFSSWLFYEDFLYRKRAFLQSTLKTLGLSTEQGLLDQMLSQSDSFRKVHSDCVEDIVENSAELHRAFPELYDEYLQIRADYGL